MANNDRLRGSLGGIRKIFTDTFNRNDRSGLGTASDGSIWTQVRGAFNIVGGSASGGDSNYPIAAVKMPYSDVKIELKSISQGAGAALWVSDSGNWWAVGVDTVQQQVCQTCYTCNAYASNCNGNYNTAYFACNGGYNASTCNGNISYIPATCANYYDCSYSYNYTTNCLGSYYFCYTYCGAANSRYGYCNSYVTNCATNYYYYSCTATQYVPQTCCNYYAAYSVCNGYYNTSNCINGTYYPSNCNGNMNSECISQSSYDCNCTFIYPKYVRLIKSVASTISEVSSWALASAANSLRVKTSGSQLTIQAYSDQNLVTQIGSDIVYTPSNVNIETMYGITVKPSNHDQGYAIGEITITKN